MPTWPFKNKESKRSKKTAAYHISQPLETMNSSNVAPLLNRPGTISFEITRPIYQPAYSNLLGPPQIIEPAGDRGAMLHAAGSAGSILQGDRPVSFLEPGDWHSDRKSMTSRYGVESSRVSSRHECRVFLNLSLCLLELTRL